MGLRIKISREQLWPESKVDALMTEASKVATQKMQDTYDMMTEYHKKRMGLVLAVAEEAEGSQLSPRERLNQIAAMCRQFIAYKPEANEEAQS